MNPQFNLDRPLVGVVFEEDGECYAVCLNHFLMTSAPSRREIPDAIRRMLRAHVAACAHQGLDPFEDLAPAPEKYWRMFLRSREVVVETEAEAAPPEVLSYKFHALPVAA